MIGTLAIAVALVGLTLLIVSVVRDSRIPNFGGWTADRARVSPAALPFTRVRRVPIRRCERCGCTDDHACAGGCSWAPLPPVVGDFCTRCVTPSMVGLAWSLVEDIA